MDQSGEFWIDPCGVMIDFYNLNRKREYNEVRRALRTYLKYNKEFCGMFLCLFQH